MAKIKFVSFYFFSFLFFTLPAFGQDYPYEGTQSATEGSKIPKESPQQNLVTEPYTNKSSAAGSIFRTQVKIGANWSWIQVPISNQALGSTTLSGLGIEGLLGFVWDLKNQPLSLELESGYRGVLSFKTEKLHSIPFGFGFFYRSRSGPRSLAKIGFKSGLEYRYTPYLRGDGTQGLSWGINPYFAFAVPLEFSGFLIEPLVQINRIQTDLSNISTALRFGFVF